MQTVCGSLQVLHPFRRIRKRGRCFFPPSVFHHGFSLFASAAERSRLDNSHHTMSLPTQFVLQFPRVRLACVCRRKISAWSNMPSLYADDDAEEGMEKFQQSKQKQKEEENVKFSRDTIVTLVSTTGAIWPSLHKNRILCPRTYTDDQLLAKFEPIIYFDKQMMRRAREILYEYDQEMAMNLDSRVLLLGREAVYPTPCSKENEGPPPLYDDFADNDDSADSKTTQKILSQTTMASALPNDDDDTVDVEEDRGIEEKSNAPDDNDPVRPRRSREDVLQTIRNNGAVVEETKRKRDIRQLTKSMNEDRRTGETIILRERLHQPSLEEYDALLFLVAERLHFFFSDAVARQHGIIRTRFLMKRDGSIPFDKLLTFQSIRELTDSPKVLIEAAKVHCADELVINEKNDGIRRIVQFTLDKMKDHIPKSLYLFALPHDPKKNRYYTSTAEIRTIFFLTPILVTLRFRDERHPKTGKLIKRIPKGSALVEFEKVAQMERVAADCLTRVNGKAVIPRRPLLLMPRDEEPAKPPRLVHAMKLADFLKERKNGFYPNDSFRRLPGMHGEYLNAFGSPNMYK